MAEIHDLITRDGIEAARRAAQNPTDRSIVEISADILSEESRELGFLYAGWCLTALPHKKLPDDAVWKRQGHKLTLIVEPGFIHPRNGPSTLVGVPYGSRARLILLYCQTKALQTSSQEIELGRSMHEWLSRMGVAVGGKTYQDIRAQADRISACHLTFIWDHGKQGQGFSKSSLVKGGFRLNANGDSRQGELWQDTVRLSDEFFSALKEHPVPVWEPAIREISNQSMALDIYVWLAYRLHSLRKPMPISWMSLQEQFGAGFSSSKSFRQTFRIALKYAMAVYPDAKIDVIESGLTLHQSRPPIERSTVVALSRRGT